MLDSFPINGGATNFDASYMGVPILTKISENNAWFRSGVSINKNLKINNIIFSQRYRGDDPKLDFEVSLNSTSTIIELLKNKMTKDSSIVLISSIAIKTILDDQPLSYHLTRAGIYQMTKYYAVTLGSKGIRFNCVLPTKIIKPENYKFYNKKNNPITLMMKKITPLKRMGNSQDVANLVEFLCSDQSCFITGNSFFVDGGLSLVGQESIARGIGNIK